MHDTSCDTSNMTYPLDHKLTSYTVEQFGISKSAFYYCVINKLVDKLFICSLTVQLIHMMQLWLYTVNRTKSLFHLPFLLIQYIPYKIILLILTFL